MNSSNMLKHLSSQQLSKFNIPILQHHKWKRRSAPDLRECVKREELVRSLSHYDLPLSYTLDMDGRIPLYIDTKEYKEAPSLLWGQEAYCHYKLLTMIETKKKLEMIQNAKATIIKKYMWKQRVLQNIVNVAKAYYQKPCDENREKWKQLRREIQQSSKHSLTDIQDRLAHIPRYAPFFTFFLMLAHIVSLTVMCIVGKLGPAGVLSEKNVGQEIQTFLGAETFHRYTIPNPWIGPPATTFLGRLRKFRKLDSSFGCCEMRGSFNTAGTTTQAECSNYTNDAGVWRQPRCSQRAPGQNSVAHVIRPCCVDHRGICQMLSLQHCNFLGGTFYTDKEHCVEVLCVRDVCRAGKNLSFITPNPDKPWLPREQVVWQWWRLLLALFYTFGLVHCLMLLLLEWLLMRPMEGSTGWYTVLFIYTMCGVAGQLISCTAQPYVPHVGSTSGMAGIIGEAAVELIQAWTFLERPRVEAIKLACFFGVLVAMSFLPFVSLLGTLTGCLCGAVCALIFMPYLTFSKQDQYLKVLLMTTGVVLLATFFIVSIYVFGTLQPHPCKACRRLDCVSFSDDMCNDWDLLG